MTTHQRNFGIVEAFIRDDVAEVAVGRFRFTESELNDLADDIRSAQCWLRDIRRRQAENETPELPMQ